MNAHSGAGYLYGVALIKAGVTDARGPEVWWMGRKSSGTFGGRFPMARGSVVWTDGLFKSGNIERVHPVGITQSLQESHILHERVRAVADIVVPAFDGVLFNLYLGGHIA